MCGRRQWWLFSFPLSPFMLHFLLFWRDPWSSKVFETFRKLQHREAPGNPCGMIQLHRHKIWAYTFWFLHFYKYKVKMSNIGTSTEHFHGVLYYSAYFTFVSGIVQFEHNCWRRGETKAWKLSIRSSSKLARGNVVGGHLLPHLARDYLKIREP